MRDKIEKIIRETLVIDNKKSIPLCCEKIIAAMEIYNKSKNILLKTKKPYKMKNSQKNYLPGPWVVNYGGTKGHIKSISPDNEDGDTPTVCICDIFPKQSIYAAYQNYNAQLISAAPDLLDALEVCYAALCTYGKHPIIEAQVEKALDKATNEYMARGYNLENI